MYYHKCITVFFSSRLIQLSFSEKLKAEQLIKNQPEVLRLILMFGNHGNAFCSSPPRQPVFPVLTLFFSCHFLVGGNPFHSIRFGLLVQFFSQLRTDLLQGSETNFAQQVIPEAFRRFFGIQDERVLALFLQLRVVTVGSPVTAGNGAFLFQLAAAPAGFQAVVDAGAVRND